MAALHQSLPWVHVFSLLRWILSASVCLCTQAASPAPRPVKSTRLVIVLAWNYLGWVWILGCVIRDKILSTLWVSGASSENWGNKAPLGVYMRIKLNNTCRVLSIKYGTSQSTLKNISYCHYYNYSLENGQLSAQPHRLYIPWGHQQANMRALTGSFHFCVVRDSASHRPAGPGKRHHTWVSPSLWFGIIPHFMHSI